jgi:hypothetical protein
MEKFLKVVYYFVLVILGVYLIIPSSSFPTPPNDAIRSQEPADMESPLRRGYFTNYSREEVVSHYKKQFENQVVKNINLPTYRLNYPPEDAQFLIRDQTRSTFLEELVHPLRETLYINGFEYQDKTKKVGYKGVEYRQKIIIRYVPSNLILRLFIVFSGLLLFRFVIKKWIVATKSILTK